MTPLWPFIWLLVGATCLGAFAMGAMIAAVWLGAP